ncbi:rhodanese-like domain-containing protein, partial [Dissulfurirhabdus thermomarina]
PGESGAGERTAARYAALVRAGDRAFRNGDFAGAAERFRSAIVIRPADDAAWSRYRLAVLAAAGDDYLTSVPEDRYRVTPAELEQALRGGGPGFFLLDVRDPEEFDKGHLKDAVNIPFRRVLRHLDLLPGKDAPILLVCHTQRRAIHVLVVLRELGFTRVYTLKGGYAAYLKWKRRGAG